MTTTDTLASLRAVYAGGTQGPWEVNQESESYAIDAPKSGVSVADETWRQLTELAGRLGASLDNV